MWLTVGNLNVKASRYTTEERAWLLDYLSFANPNARFSGAPPKTVMFNIMNDCFAAGFLPLVKRAAADKGLDVQLFERRVFPCAEDASADLAWLRPYQLDAVKRVASAKRGILWLPTGAGKTEIAVGLTRILPTDWLFLTHRATLTDQSADRYELRSPGLRAGRVGEGSFDIPAGASFVVATFQTLAAALKSDNHTTQRRAQDLLEWAKGIIVDECHVLPAASFLAVTRRACNAVFRVGLSGTPLARGDRRSLNAIAELGPVVYRIKPEVLIEAGVLARPHIRLIECRQRSDKPTWQGVYGDAVVRGARRNRLVVEATKRAVQNGPVLVFVKEVAHGRILEKLMWRHGLKTEFTYGNHSVDFRKSKVRSLIEGRIDALVCSVVFQEGVDIPSLRSVVIASGGKSVIASLQRIGRGMRVDASTGKKDFDVYDIMDKGCGCKEAAKALGTPGVGLHPGCKWLDKHAKARMNAYTSEGHSTTIEQWVDQLVLPPEELAADATVIQVADASKGRGVGYKDAQDETEDAPEDDDD